MTEPGPNGAPSIEVFLLPGAGRLAAAHRSAGAQPDNLCGPYWISTLLRMADGTKGRGVTPEEASLASRTLVPASGDPTAWLPKGEVSRADYGAPIPTASHASRSGTSIRGMLAAMGELSGGAYGFLPVRGHSGRPFDGAAVHRLADALVEHPDREAVPVLNVRTGKLWGTRVLPVDVLAFLAGSRIEPPEPEWDVGHFLTLAALVRGPSRSMLLLRDTYPSLGWEGYHLQPVEAVAAALRRDDGREGGCLLFLRADTLLDSEREMKELGFDIGVWDNGTPYEQGGGAK